MDRHSARLAAAILFRGNGGSSIPGGTYRAEAHSVVVLFADLKDTVSVDRWSRRRHGGRSSREMPAGVLRLRSEPMAKDNKEKDKNSRQAEA